MADELERPELNWLDDVEEDNYSAAQDYVALRWAPDHAMQAVAKLREAEPIAGFQPSDILRAAQQPVLEMANPGVIRELRRLLVRGVLSPILLVNLPEFLIIADGYHRTCLAYHVTPFRRVPCRIISYIDPDGPVSRYRLMSESEEETSLSTDAVHAEVGREVGGDVREAVAAIAPDAGIDLWADAPWSAPEDE